MPAREYYLEQIDRELDGARRARLSGNEGKARVCARRAAGCALGWFLSAHPREGWGADALRRLAGAREDAGFPAEVRAAAARLSAKISGQFEYSGSSDPLEDAALLVRHVRAVMEGGHADAS